MSKTIFISGATSGIGEACATIFAKNGNRLIITGRRKERLINLKNKLEKEYDTEILILNFDVQEKKEVFESINSIPEQWMNIDILINNAGLSLGRDNFAEASLEDWETMMHTNVDGLMYVTKAILPMLIKSKGHIINIGSIAGKEIYENGNVYCASKFAVDALSKSMRIDLLKHEIKVTAIHPGAVETEFSLIRYKGDKAKAEAVYKGMKPLTGHDIASIIFYTTQLPHHVCINELTVTPVQQASTFHFHKFQTD